MKSVCVVTSTRADYGIMRPLIRRFHEANDIGLYIVATGMHLCPEFGNTFQEIKADGFDIHRCIDIQLSGDSPAVMSKSMGMALIGFADYFREFEPNAVVILGDRYEAEAICCSAINQRIPVIHLYGGEVTTGAVDNGFRHAITKMSSLHFTNTEVYRTRIIQMGEHPETVFNHGSMSVENIYSLQKPSLSELAKSLDFPLEEKKFSVVTFHPVTLENTTGLIQVRELMAALDTCLNWKFIITKANSDAGGRAINSEWEHFAEKRHNCVFVDSLGAKRYLSALKHASMMIGNSSSGIVEGPASGIPTVNIGDRQRGRIRGDSIIDCTPDKDSIITAITRAASPEFQKLAEAAANPYGDGQASKRIFTTIQDFMLHEKLTIQKIFYDIYL